MYIAGQGSLRDLSKRFGIPLRTLERRCSKEGWRRAIHECGGVVAATAKETAIQEGRRIGITAASLIARTLQEVPVWLNRIEALAQEEPIQPQTLRSLVQSWREVIALGRITLHLDEELAPGHSSGWGFNSSAPIIDVSPQPLLPTPTDPSRQH